MRCTTGRDLPQPCSHLPPHQVWAWTPSPRPTLPCRCLDYILEEIKHSQKASVMVASHNEDTIKFTLRRWGLVRRGRCLALQWDVGHAVAARCLCSFPNTKVWLAG